MTGSERYDDEAGAIAADWALRMREAPEDPALRAELDDWRAAAAGNDAAYRGAARMLEVARALPPDYLDLARPARSRLRNAALAAGMGIAACLLLLLLPDLRLRIEADLVTGTGEIRRVVLPDGSAIHLDSGSAVAIHYAADRRSVDLLAGHAFFEVAPNPVRPFVVAAGGFRATVTGTAFEVRSDPDTIGITLQSGAVDVALDDGARPIASLRPGEGLVVARADGRIERIVGASDVAPWRDRRLVVDGIPLARVVAELGRYHPGLVLLRDDALGAKRITGSFDLGAPAEALQALLRAQRAQVTSVTPWLMIVSGPRGMAAGE